MEEQSVERKETNFKDIYQYQNDYVYEIHSISGQAKDILCIRPSGGEPFFLSQKGERIESERICYNEKVYVKGYMPLEFYKEKHGEFWLDPSVNEEAMVSVDTDEVDEVIANRFGPSIKLSKESLLRVTTISELSLGLASFINEHCPNNPEKDNAINFLQMAKMSAVASIASYERILQNGH